MVCMVVLIEMIEMIELRSVLHVPDMTCPTADQNRSCSGSMLIVECTSIRLSTDRTSATVLVQALLVQYFTAVGGYAYAYWLV
jgi:hypothetical protein